MRRAPDPTSRSVAAPEATDLGSAVPSPAFAFLLALIALPSLFWLVAFKRTTGHTVPEDWLMVDVVPPFQHWVVTHVPPLDALLVGISGLGSGWFVGLGFGVAGLFALARGRTDLALVLAAGTLAFPIEWALKYFTYLPEPGHAPLSLIQLWNALFEFKRKSTRESASARFLVLSLSLYEEVSMTLKIFRFSPSAFITSAAYLMLVA